MEETLALLAPSSTSTTYNVVLRPGGTPGGNVYTSWAALYAASVAGKWQGQVLVTVDDSIATPVHLTPGDFTIGPALNWTFVAVASYADARGNAALAIDDGMHWTPTGPVQMTFVDLDITSNATTVTMVAGPSQEVNLLLDGTSIVCTDAAFLAVDQAPAPGGFCICNLHFFSVIGDGTHAVLIGGAGFLTCNVLTGSFLQDDAITVGGIIVYDASSFLDANTYGAGFTVLRQDLAAFAVPATGTTAERPVGPNALAVGQMFFDQSVAPTDGGAPLWWNTPQDRWVGPALFGTAIGQAPTIAAGVHAGAGASASFPATSDDTAGTIGLTTGAVPGPSAGAQVTVSFTTPLPGTPRAVHVTPMNAATAIVDFFLTWTNTGWTINAVAGHLPASETDYAWSYVVVP